MKKKLREATQNTVAVVGWQALFDRFDTDGSGQLDMAEFIDAVRHDMDISNQIITDDQLRALFQQVSILRLSLTRSRSR